MCLFLLGIFFFSLKKTKQQLVLYIIKIRKPSLTLHLMESMLAWNEGFLFLHSVCIIFQASDILYLQHCSFLFVMRASLRWKMLCPQPVTLKCPNARLLNIFRKKKAFSSCCTYRLYLISYLPYTNHSHASTRHVLKHKNLFQIWVLNKNTKTVKTKITIKAALSCSLTSVRIVTCLLYLLNYIFFLFLNKV